MESLPDRLPAPGRNSAESQEPRPTLSLGQELSARGLGGTLSPLTWRAGWYQGSECQCRDLGSGARWLSPPRLARLSVPACPLVCLSIPLRAWGLLGDTAGPSLLCCSPSSGHHGLA